jgi:hypothetical protein
MPITSFVFARLGVERWLLLKLSGKPEAAEMIYLTRPSLMSLEAWLIRSLRLAGEARKDH